MATDGRDDAVLETSVLVNFLAIDRVDLLASHPSYRFIITDHVRDEITSNYPEQVERLERAVSATILGVKSVDSLDPTFITLIKRWETWNRRMRGDCTGCEPGPYSLHRR
jgi:hypothetical protein